MPRGRRADAETPEEVVAVQDEPTEDAEGTPFGEPVEIEVTEEDLAAEEDFESGSEAEEEAEEEAVEAEAEVVESEEDEAEIEEPEAEAEEVEELPDGFVRFVYVGSKVETERTGATITVIVPEDGTTADDPTALIEHGKDFTLHIGVVAVGTEEEVAWLESHPVYDIKRA